MLTTHPVQSRAHLRRGSHRDSAVTALILGFFSAAWFSWGQADASDAMSTAMTVGSSVALVVAVLGAFRLCSGPRIASALHDPVVGRRYLIVVCIEFALAGLGAVALGAIGVPAYIPVWICAVVGVHFFALAGVFEASALRWLGAAVTAVAAVALLLGALTTLTPGSLTGAGAGVALLAYAILVLR